MSHHIFLRVANVFVFAFFLSANVYALLGPEAGNPYYSHGRETYLTPAPFTFAVWGLIHLLLLGFVVYQFFERPRTDTAALNTRGDRTASIDAIGSAFVFATLLNSMWFHLWQSHHYILAALVMAGVTSAISYVYYALDEYPARTAAETVFIHAPFSLWHAWSVVTLVLSISAVFTELHNPLHPGVWRATLSIVAMVFLASTAIGYTEVGAKRRGDIAGALVIAWALFGIFAQQPAASIHWTALALGIVVTIYAVKPFAFGQVRGSQEESAPLLR